MTVTQVAALALRRVELAAQQRHARLLELVASLRSSSITCPANYVIARVGWYVPRSTVWWLMAISIEIGRCIGGTLRSTRDLIILDWLEEKIAVDACLVIIICWQQHVLKGLAACGTIAFVFTLVAGLSTCRTAMQPC